MVKTFLKKHKLKVVIGAIVLALLAVVAMLGTNDSGYYTVIQHLNGRMKVVTKPGIYFKGLGKTTKYRIADTLYFSKWLDESKSKEDTSVDVMFTDGSKGYISMNVRYRLPSEHDKILLLHETFKTDRDFKLGAIEQLSMQAAQTTASMMTAEDSYRNKRPQFISMIMDQVMNGLYETKTSHVTGPDGERYDTQEILRDENGAYVRKPRDLDAFGVIITQVNVTDIDYEPSVLAQIDRKREASMEAELAKVEAEKARQANVQAEEEGKRNVTVARYQEEEIKIKELTRAQKEKEVAELQAQQELAVAEIRKQQAQIEVETADLMKQATILKAEGEAEAKRLLMEADGALEQKLKALTSINEVWANAYTKQRPTPDVVVGGGDNTGTSAQTLMDIVMMRALQDLSLDVGIKK